MSLAKLLQAILQLYTRRCGGTENIIVEASGNSKLGKWSFNIQQANKYKANFTNKTFSQRSHIIFFSNSIPLIFDRKLHSLHCIAMCQ